MYSNVNEQVCTKNSRASFQLPSEMGAFPALVRLRAAELLLNTTDLNKTCKRLVISLALALNTPLCLSLAAGKAPISEGS